MASRGPVLGLDYGTRRIGLAVSDPDRRLAFPAGSLARRGGRRDLDALAELAAERGVARVVVGLPLHMDGGVGDMARAARAFAEALAQRTGLPVELLDERWTSREAERSLRDAGGGRRPKKGRGRRAAGEVDAVAATLLLRTYLERSAAPAEGAP